MNAAAQPAAPTLFAVYLVRRARPVLVEAASIYDACDLADRKYGRRVDLVTAWVSR
jgi:hypothetical protein